MCPLGFVLFGLTFPDWVDFSLKPCAHAVGWLFTRCVDLAPPPSRWWFQRFFIFTPILGAMIQFEEHIFQMGWKHQLDNFAMAFCLFLFGRWTRSLEGTNPESGRFKKVSHRPYLLGGFPAIAMLVHQRVILSFLEFAFWESSSGQPWNFGTYWDRPCPKPQWWVEAT